MTGSNMSGDLKDPQQSIPSGTIAAQLTTSFVYLSFVVVFGGTVHGHLLRDKYGTSLGSGMVVAELAWPSRWVLLIGSFTSTFGAALQCLCSAPRLLQSIAKDNVIPILAPFSEVTARNEPFRGLIVTTLIAELAILIGAVDYIAPVVDLFFLMCYAFVNLVCALHSLLGAPNWRPRFRFYHWTLSLLGAALCLFIMFATYWYYALVAIALCLIIYRYAEWKGAKKEWGDGIRGLALSTAQFSLLKVEDKDPHPKNWRPQVLLLTKLNEELEPKYAKMLELCGQLKAGKGLTMVATLIHGDPTNPTDRNKATDIKELLKVEMEKAKLKGFAKTVVYEAEHMASSISTLIQSAGIGGLRPNTIMVGWPNTWRRASATPQDDYWDFIDKIHRGASLDMCLMIPKGIEDFPDLHDRLAGFIDVWWILQDGGLLILLSFLLNQHKVWRGCRLRLFAVAQESDNSIQMKKDLEQFLYHLRIQGLVHVVEFSAPEISAYAYERTLLMEERTQLVRDLHLSEKERKQLLGHRLFPQFLVDKHRSVSTNVGPGYHRQVSGGTKEFSQDTDFTTAPHTPDEERLLKPEDAIPGQRRERLESLESALSDEEDEDSLEERERKDTIASLKGQPENNGLSDQKYQYTFTPRELEKELTSDRKLLMGMANRKDRQHRLQALDRKKVKKMHTAVQLNIKIREWSKDSQLVVLNLPRPPRSPSGLQNYIEYLEALTDSLKRVLLVRGSGKEVITIYS